MCCAYMARVFQAVALGFLIDYFGGGNDKGYLWAFLIVACGVIILFEHHHVFFIAWHKGMQLRLAGVAAIYEKSLKLSSTHQNTSASYGRIMNLASNDVERFIMAALFVSHLIWAPLQSIAILIVGCLFLGPSFAAGFALLVMVFVPLQFYLGGRFAHFRSKIAAITDQRVTFVSQAVRGVRVMKMSGYEWRFLERIQKYREAETSQIGKANQLKSWNEALFYCTNVVVAVTIFLVHTVLLGKELKPGDVFTVFTLINIMQLEMTKHVALGVMSVSECYVSISRIQKFLEFPELPHDRIDNEGTSPVYNNKLDLTASAMEMSLPSGTHADNMISMNKVKCYWNEVKENSRSDKQGRADLLDGSTGSETSKTQSLVTAVEDVSLTFKRGELTAVIGTVGCGKSALLQAIVQELPVSSGTVRRLYKSLSYAAQDPWIMDGTVKENIVMGLPWNEDWYNQVVKACSLLPDFEQFRDGDRTVVGDRGVQCSGGQRARIGLARALYRDADVLVADDPLSAVDSKVGRQLFQEAIIGLGLSRGKCVILATHQHQYVSECRCVLIMAGRVVHDGTYDECVTAAGGALHAHAADDGGDEVLEEEQNDGDDGLEMTDDVMGDDQGRPKGIEGDTDNEELNRQGIVRADTYVKYLEAMGGVWVGMFLLVLFSATQGSVLATVTMFGRWAERDTEDQDNLDIVLIVTGLTALVVVLAIYRAFVSLQLTVRASRRLHDRMAKSVLRAKVEFFDTNPLGRILNRFSADIGISDDQLPVTMFDFFVIAFIVLGAVITTLITMPFTLVAIPPLTWYFLSVRRIFVTSTRELKRLEGLARSPIFAMISESLGGIATIRANDSLVFFRQKFDDAHDAHTRAFFGFIAASRWVGFRMDSIMFLFLATVCVLSVLFHHQGWFDVDPAILGLSLSMILQLAGMFQWCIRQSAEVVNQMVSIERVLAFGELEPEAPLALESDTSVVDKAWPSRGELSFDQVTVRYRASLPPALEDVSFRIPAGSRVGIVGRTGSGKSTLLQALFRLLEAEKGRIVIDDIDVAKLGLHALRTRISVIPQVPTLFSGCTVRENLDLFQLHSDERIRKVIEDCHLSSVIAELPSGWDSIVAESGSNFSVGQRQLLCLARAILSQNKILVLDEATASVDRRTDQLIQRTLHECFHDGTIIAVAHRLDTVIEYDYILVLGKGRVLEFGSPADLIKAGGAFASMVTDTGETMSRSLRMSASRISSVLLEE